MRPSVTNPLSRDLDYKLPIILSPLRAVILNLSVRVSAIVFYPSLIYCWRQQEEILSVSTKFSRVSKKIFAVLLFQDFYSSSSVIVTFFTAVKMQKLLSSNFSTFYKWQKNLYSRIWKRNCFDCVTSKL